MKTMLAERNAYSEKLKKSEITIQQLRQQCKEALNRENETKSKFEQMLKQTEAKLVELQKSSNEAIQASNQMNEMQMKRINELESDFERLKIEKEQEISELRKQIASLMNEKGLLEEQLKMKEQSLEKIESAAKNQLEKPKLPPRRNTVHQYIHPSANVETPDIQSRQSVKDLTGLFSVTIYFQKKFILF